MRHKQEIGDTRTPMRRNLRRQSRDWGQSDMPTSQREPPEARAGPGADASSDSPEGTDPAHTLILDSWPQELRRLSVNFCHFQSPVCSTHHSSRRKLTQVLGCAGVWIPSTPPHPPASCELGAFGRWGVGEYHTFPKNMGGSLARRHFSASRSPLLENYQPS